MAASAKRRAAGLARLRSGRQPAIPWERRMTEGKRFAQLLKEFERVGVDPNTISAGLAVREEDALRALHALPTTRVRPLSSPSCGL